MLNIHTCVSCGTANLLDTVCTPYIETADSATSQVEADNLDIVTRSALLAQENSTWKGWKLKHSKCCICKWRYTAWVLALIQHCFVHALTLPCMNACFAKAFTPLHSVRACKQVAFAMLSCLMCCTVVSINSVSTPCVADMCWYTC